jgi:hypothetical protein
MPEACRETVVIRAGLTAAMTTVAVVVSLREAFPGRRCPVQRSRLHCCYSLAGVGDEPRTAVDSDRPTDPESARASSFSGHCVEKRRRHPGLPRFGVPW